MLQALNSILQKGAVKHGSRIAVSELNGKTISYLALHRQALDVCSLLVAQGIAPGNRVGILGPKSIDCISFIFGIMYGGGAYVPLDANAPLLRNLLVLKDCALKAVFIHSSQLAEYELRLGEDHRYEIKPFNMAFSLIVFHEKFRQHKQDLAYILYTSGSTGIPKGVMHTHKSAEAFVSWSVKKFKPAANDVFASIAPFHFDLSVFDLFVALSVGASVAVFDHSIAANPLLFASELALKKITFIYATPTTLTHLRRYGKLHKYSYRPLKCVLFAGEVFPLNDLKEVKEGFQGAAFYNLYGPTETNVCTFYKVPDLIPSGRTEPFPIGKACSFASTKIDGNGVSGELLVAGESVMQGYWNDRAKTKKAFKTLSGQLWYKTGDLVTIDKTGNYVYTGRKDRMIKRRGYRIEPGEVETVLNNHPGISQTAVCTNAAKLIVAHVVARKSGILTEAGLYEYCQTALPSYMIPDRFQFHRQLPVTSTQKIDYKTLSSIHD